jgi:hypothetical protein
MFIYRHTAVTMHIKATWTIKVESGSLEQDLVGYIDHDD